MCHKHVNPYVNEDYSVNGVGVLPYQEGEVWKLDTKVRLGYMPLLNRLSLGTLCEVNGSLMGLSAGLD